MRERPHILSTRLGPAEVGEYVRALAAPGGGWYVPAAYARWAVLRHQVTNRVSIGVDTDAIRGAMAPFRAIGREVNGVAHGLNRKGKLRLAIMPDMGWLASSWPDAASSVLAAVRPTGVEIICPVPVQATAPAAARVVPPAFRQHHHGVRVRQIVVATRLTETEQTQVIATAEAAGADPADYFRSRLLGGDPLRQRRLPRPAARALAAVLEEAGRQANNFRQIGGWHDQAGWPMPPVLIEAQAALWTIRDAIMPTLARWRL